MTRILGLVALVWVVYWSSLHNPFVYDDFYMIAGNPAVTGPADLGAFFSDPSQLTTLQKNRDYRPLFLVSMSLCWWLGGGDTLPFHLLSVTLHLGNVLLLFFLVRLMLTQKRYGVGSGSSSLKEWTAFFSAALFAVHPLATQAVDFMTQQSVMIMAFFYLLSFYLFLRAYGTDRPSPAGTPLKLGSYLAYSLSLLSKAPAITLPVNLLMWELLFGRSSNRGSDAPPGQPSGWARLLKHLPFFALSAGYYLLRVSVFSHKISRIQGKRLSTLESLTQTAVLVLYYLRRAVFPFQLSIDPVFPPVQGVWDIRLLVALLVLGLIVGLLIRYRRKKLIVFWALWFPICLLVTSYLVRLSQTVAEHRVYLSLVGMAALAGLLFHRLRGGISDSSRRDEAGVDLAVWMKPLVAPLLILILGTATVSRNRVWSSGLTLWEDAVLKGGSWRAHLNYGVALKSAERSEESYRSLQRAFEMDPNAFTHLNLGLAQLGRGAQAEGLSHLRRAVEIDPSLVEGHLFLAYGLEQTGLLQEAEKELQEAIRLRPNLSEPLRSLGEFYERRGDWVAALAAYREMLKREPDPATEERISSAPFLLQLGLSYEQKGNRQEATRILEDLVRKDPSQDEASFHLARIYLDGNTPAEWERSEALLRRVLERDARSYPDAFYYLGTAARRLGKVDEGEFYDRLYLQRGADEEFLEAVRLRLKGLG